MTIAVETPETFDSVLYVRSADCSDSDAEVACNDDAPTPGTNETNRQHSRIEQVLDAGTIFVFVDGYSGAAGSFKMHVEPPTSRRSPSSATRRRCCWTACRPPGPPRGASTT